jgi:hypothetical protein
MGHASIQMEPRANPPFEENEKAAAQPDYADARRKAIEWLGDRYLLADPVPKLHEYGTAGHA